MSKFKPWTWFRKQKSIRIKHNINVAVWKPNSIDFFIGREETNDDNGIIKWVDDDELKFDAIVQTAPFSTSFGLMYHVREGEPHTFNPFLQHNFDPETYSRYGEIAERYFRGRGYVVDEAFKKVDWQNEPNSWISSGLLGVLGKDRSDADFFNAMAESKLMLVLKMAAGIAVWEAVQRLIQLLGEAF